MPYLSITFGYGSLSFDTPLTPSPGPKKEKCRLSIALQSQSQTFQKTGAHLRIALFHCIILRSSDADLRLSLDGTYIIKQNCLDTQEQNYSKPYTQ